MSCRENICRKKCPSEKRRGIVLTGSSIQSFDFFNDLLFFFSVICRDEKRRKKVKWKKVISPLFNRIFLPWKTNWWTDVWPLLIASDVFYYGHFAKSTTKVTVALVPRIREAAHKSNFYTHAVLVPYISTTASTVMGCQVWKSNWPFVNLSCHILEITAITFREFAFAAFFHSQKPRDRFQSEVRGFN